MEPVMSIEEVLAAGARLDSSDTAVALRLARSSTASEAEAWELLNQAQQHAERIASTLDFQAAVQRLADVLLRERELDGQEVTAIIDKEISNGQDND